MTKLNWNKAKRYKEYIPLKPDYRNSSRSHYDRRDSAGTYSGRAYPLTDSQRQKPRKRYRELVDQGIG